MDPVRGDRKNEVIPRTCMPPGMKRTALGAVAHPGTNSARISSMVATIPLQAGEAPRAVNSPEPPGRHRLVPAAADAGSAMPKMRW